MQLVKKEMALAIALAQKRFPEGSATGDRRHAAEEEFAQALAKLGGVLNDAVVMAMAAEAFMNLSPWDYYEVSQCMQSLKITEQFKRLLAGPSVRILEGLCASLFRH